MSLHEIYEQLQMLRTKGSELHDGMGQEMTVLKQAQQAAIKNLKGKEALMTAWASETRESVRRSEELNAEGSSPARQFMKELGAVMAEPIPSGSPQQRSNAMKAREQAISRIHQKWDPKIRENEREANAAARAMRQQNRSYEKKVESYDRQREIHKLQILYSAEANQVRNKWSPGISDIGARQQALRDELRRRCPQGSALSPDKQRCYK